MPTKQLDSSYTRVWLQSGGPGPSRVPSYHGNWKPGSPSWDQGSLTVTREPDPSRYGKFIRTGGIIGAPGDPKLTISARTDYNRSRLLKLAREGCNHSVQVHFGQCQNPENFNRGWEKILVIEEARITTWKQSDLGAMDQGQIALITEDVDVVGVDMYEIVRMSFGEQAAALIGREVMAVHVCDSVQCASCGITSDGCQVVFAAVDTSVGSPGYPGMVVFTQNGGASYDYSNITTLAATEHVSGMTCVGENVVVASVTSESFHWASIASLLAGSGVWAEVNTGFVAGHGPKAVHALSGTQMWAVGVGGYVYYSEDPTASVTVQDSGSATTQDLNDVHALNAEVVIAVGNSNAVIATVDGGTLWQSIVGPAVGVNLNACWARSESEWLVGTAGGKLFYTTDAGSHWTEVTFPGSGAGVVRDIAFATDSVGYMAHNTATPAGRILRTIDGGRSWYVMPEASGSIPANDYIRSITTCADPNVIFAGGLADNATDGILVKGA